jgi:hypothetical protein
MFALFGFTKMHISFLKLIPDPSTGNQHVTPCTATADHFTTSFSGKKSGHTL